MDFLPLLLQLLSVFGQDLFIALFAAAFIFFVIRTEKRLAKGDIKFDEQYKLVKRVALISLKTEMLHNEFPIEDRMKAYTQYRELGGNGYIDTYYEKVLKPIAEKKAMEQDE